MPSCSRKNRCARLALYCTIGCFATAALGSDRPAQAAEPSTGTARTAPAGIRRLLIVAPEKFQPALENYVAFKKRFLPTEFATLEEVLDGSPGVDDPEKLKHFIYDAWRNRKVWYVLLVGDRDIMPVRYMVLDRVTPAAFDYAFYPSDLYYGDLAKDDGSFDNWNAQHRGFHSQYFGEVRGEKNKHDPMNYDQIHYRCQVAVGRWPVDTAKQLETVMAKSMKYETSVRDGTHAGLNKVSLFNVQGFVDARDQLDRIRHGLPRDWQGEEFFYRDQNPKYKTAAPDPSVVLDALNQGCIVSAHVGHGSETSWAGPRDGSQAGPAITTRSIQQLTNGDRLPVIFSVGCSTAYFAPLGPYEPYTDIHGVEHKGTDHGEVFTSPPPPPAAYQKLRIKASLGKSLLMQGPTGAVAYIGCNTGGQPCALTLLEGFMGGLRAEREPRLGDCWRRAIAYYYDHEHLATLTPTADWYPASIFFQGMKYMLYGDPSLPLAQPPQR